MVERPEWRPGLCASACIPWGSDLARSLMNACVATWMALPGGTRLEDVLDPSAELVRHHILAAITDVERTSAWAEGVEEQVSGGGGAASLAATALRAGPYALAVRLLAGCGVRGRAWTSDERLGAARRVLNRRILRSGGASGGPAGEEADAAAEEADRRRRRRATTTTGPVERTLRQSLSVCWRCSPRCTCSRRARAASQSVARWRPSWCEAIATAQHLQGRRASRRPPRLPAQPAHRRGAGGERPAARPVPRGRTLSTCCSYM
jgi:hypothetical protein